MIDHLKRTSIGKFFNKKKEHHPVAEHKEEVTEPTTSHDEEVTPAVTSNNESADVPGKFINNVNQLHIINVVHILLL